MTTKLPLVEFRGPAIPGVSETENDAFWVLRASVPAFHQKKEKNPQQERIHSARTVLADVDSVRSNNLTWRTPRLMTLHLIAGARGRFEEDDEQLFVRLPKKTDEIESDKGKVFRTFHPETPDAAVFQQVAAEPIYADNRWPDLDNDTISVPPFRLVAGAIELRATGEAIEWLGEPLLGGRKDIVLRLTPDGIELDAKLPFPGHKDALDGRFLLFPTRGGTCVRLLPDRLTVPTQLQKWLSAWRSVTPGTDDIEDSLVGLKVEARRDGLPPAFVWRAETDDDDEIKRLSPGVDIPAADLRVRLLSPKGRNGVDGEVTLAPEVYTLAPFDRDRVKPITNDWTDTSALMLTARLESAAPSTPATRLVLDSRPSVGRARLASTSKNKVAHVCAHDEVALAQGLRAAYGFDELLPGTPDPARPLLSAFVPLDDGWLQLPVPNVPPPDLTKDEDLTVTRAIPNVLSGYLRFAQGGTLPPVLSAFPSEPNKDPEPFTVTDAPWVLTVEGAAAVDFALGLDPDDGTSDPGKETAKLVRGAASLSGPELSTRGFVWISADRPDVLESLPRLGAGAGAYIDIPIETFDIERDPILQFTIGKLGVAVTRGAPFDTVSREGLALSVSFAPDKHNGWPKIVKDATHALDEARKVLTGSTDPKTIGDVPLPLPPVIWQRHDTTPLAAEMPMTRGAASAVRPLESRDLVPFVVGVANANPVRFAHLAWEADAVFPKVTQNGVKALERRSVFGWPWPKDELKQAEGIAFAAFGVPGAEVAFGDEAKPELDPWSKLRFALRYDLPFLDEAFAMASLPPQPPESALPEERETPPPVPTPLAHDWPAMKRFWDEQNRSHQLARVHHSYLSAYRAIGNGAAASTAVQDLVGGLLWNTKVGFKTGSGALPYGEAVIGDVNSPLSADPALLGVSGTFTFDGELKKVPSTTPNILEVIGYAPESFVDDGFLFDSRRTGTRPAEIKGADRLLWRELRIREPNTGDLALATLLAPVKVGELFTFWFKDLPVIAGKFSPASPAIDFHAWQDGHLPLAGFEWRLAPTLGDPAEIFKRGRERLPFFGFLLEPLRLTGCELEMKNGQPTGNVSTATIVARLHLGPAAAGPADDGNLITIVLKADGPGKLNVFSFNGANLRFAFEAKEGAQTLPRRIAVAGGVTWDTDKPSFQVTDFTVSMFGADQRFEPATLTIASALAIAIEWSRAGSAVVEPGRGMFVVDRIRIDTKVTAAGEPDDPAVLKIDRRLLLTPRGTSVFAAPPAAIETTFVADAIGSVRIVNLSVPGSGATFIENQGGLTVTVAADVSQGEILSGFPVKGHLSLGLIARLGSATNGGMDLIAGWLDGELVARADSTLDSRVALRRIAFHAERHRRPERQGEHIQMDWIGAMRFFGTLSLDSAIGWPGVEHGADVDVVDATRSAPRSSGTDVVTIDPATFHTDHVDYVLDGHALPFDVAACVQDRRADALWAVPAVSRHTLMDKGGTTVSFTAVETIAIGAAAAIVPVLDLPNTSKPELGFSNDPVTWAGRHREIVENGEVKKKLAQGMVNAGVGRLATVLSGALGLPFRAAFGSGHSGLFLAGGFAGLVDAVDGCESPLLRLPVLAAFDAGDPLATAGFISGRIQKTTVNVAWVDGRAARQVIATLRGSVTPASASESAVRGALLAGSRTRSSSGLTPEQTAMAILVEQHFDDLADNLTKGDLEKTPFFVAAAVGLARTLPLLAAHTAPVVLSLLAGHGIREFARGLAAAVVTRNLPLTSVDDQQDRLRPHLATLGDDIVVHEWPGPPVAELEHVIPVALVAGPAFADHVEPRAVLVRTVKDGRSQYDAPTLPRGHERPRRTAPGTDRAFADSGRGYGLDPGEKPRRWLFGPEEGGTKPYRDEGDEPDVKKPQVSGLAGLSRVMALPFHASDAKVDDLVWVAQARAPIYLPLEIQSLNAPPIPWLTPGTPRSRHATWATLTDVFDTLHPPVGNVQPILPTSVTIASVGDRAGISLARIARLETAAGSVQAFDGRYARFGRPAQGGSWSVRTERTPRPAPLPPNRGDEDRDRRPCASPLLPAKPLMALEGPADRVGGEAAETIARWTVTFVAAQEWNGMASESWDGTIRLHAEIDVAIGTAAQDPTNEDAANTLFRLLFPTVTNDPKTLQARASLVIGGVVVPFRRLHVEETKGFATVGNIRRAVVPVVLDARPSDASTTRGAALGAIAEALRGATLPSMEVRLVVHPNSEEETATAPAVIALTTDAEPSLAVGDTRAPVTLRLPLAPIVRSRGALPLAPTSLLFVDPAYDVGLSSAPAEHRERLTAKGADARGALFAVLYADRARMNRKASVTFMMDISYQKKLDRREALLVDLNAVDGDIIKNSAPPTFDLQLGVVPKTGERRVLFVGTPSPAPIAGFKPPTQPKVPLAKVCELPFSSLVETDGTAATLEPGDVLELRVEESSAARIKVKVLGETTNVADAIQLDPIHDVPIARTLRMVLTDEPVVEPPPALYAALVRRAINPARLSLPLYAQSPLPWRVDLRDAKRDFRRGLMRRAATFIWSLGRPGAERPHTGIHIVKVDRNGQTHLPADTEFVPSRALRP